jgi:preprotein translocase subunit SecG
MVPLFAVLQVLLGAAVIVLVLAHSGREAGFGGIGFTPQSQGGTHIVERNLTRLTVLIAVLFAINTVVLYRLLA